MGDVIAFPDVEAQQIAYIKAALTARSVTGVWVGNRLPDPIPAKAVLVRDDSGPRLDPLRSIARVGYRVWSGDSKTNPADAFDLANLVSALVGACADGTPVVASTVRRPFSVDDPSGRPACYFTAELIVRGSNI